MHKQKPLVKTAVAAGLALVMTTGVALASIGTGTVTADSLRLRSQANTNCTTITCAPYNSTVTLLEELDGWYKVSYNGQEGYMSADWLQVNVSGTATRGVVTADALNVRSGAGTVYSRLGLLYKGATVTIVDSSVAGWYKITGGGYSGYVSAEWIQVTETGDSSNSNAGSGQATAVAAGTVNADALNVRSGAGTGYSKLGLLYKGASVSILDTSVSGWYQISFQGQTGYVSAQYITLSGSSSQEDANQSGSQQQGRVTASVLNVRSGPSTGYSKVGSLSSGTLVTIVGTESGWYKISYQGGTAYVCGDYVMLTDGSGSTATSSVGEAAAAMAADLIGSPYVYGAAGPYSFDCSGLFYSIFNKLGVPIARGSSGQYNNSGTFVSVDEMQPGDLIFIYDAKYDSSGGTLPTTHVGMYVGNDTMIHASTTTGRVMYDKVFSGYYGKYVVGVKRMG